MSTLILREVPDEVVERLQRLADRDGTSVEAMAVRELSAVSRRAENQHLLDALSDHGIAVHDLLGDLDRERRLR